MKYLVIHYKASYDRYDYDSWHRVYIFNDNDICKTIWYKSYGVRGYMWQHDNIPLERQIDSCSDIINRYRFWESTIITEKDMLEFLGHIFIEQL